MFPFLFFQSKANGPPSFILLLNNIIHQDPCPCQGRIYGIWIQFYSFWYFTLKSLTIWTTIDTELWPHWVTGNMYLMDRQSENTTIRWGAVVDPYRMPSCVLGTTCISESSPVQWACWGKSTVTSRPLAFTAVTQTHNLHNYNIRFGKS